MKSWPRIWLLVAMSAKLLVSAQAEVRVALMGAELSETGEVALGLAEAEVSGRGDVELLDRATVGRVLREQDLMAGGFVRAEDAIRLGQVLAVDVFIHVEPVPGQEALGMTAFETAQGIRLLDRGVEGTNAEALAKGIAEGVESALAKWGRAEGSGVAVALMGVRNVDLPKSRNGECEAIGALLERRLLDSPDVVVVERQRLQTLNVDRGIAPDRPEGRLLAAPVLVELDVSQNGAQEGYRVTAHLSKTMGGELGRVQAEGKASATLFAELTRGVLERLNAAVSPSPPVPEVEAARFFRQARFWKAQGRADLALAAAEAAFALAPEDPSMEGLLVNSLLTAADANLATNRPEALACAARGMAMLRYRRPAPVSTDTGWMREMQMLESDTATFFREFGKNVRKACQSGPMSGEEEAVYSEFCLDWLAWSPFAPGAATAPSGWDLLLFVNDYAGYFPDPESAWRILAEQVKRWSRERKARDLAHIPGEMLTGLVMAGDSETDPLPAGVYGIRTDLWTFLEGSGDPLLQLYGRCGRVVDAARNHPEGSWIMDDDCRAFQDELHDLLRGAANIPGLSREPVYKIAKLVIQRSGRSPGAWQTHRYERTQQQFREMLALFKVMLEAGDVRGDIVTALRNPLLNMNSLGSREFAKQGLAELDTAMAKADGDPAGAFTADERRDLQAFHGWVKEKRAPGATLGPPMAHAQMEAIDYPTLPGQFHGILTLAGDEKGGCILTAYREPARLHLQTIEARTGRLQSRGTADLELPGKSGFRVINGAGVCLTDAFLAVSVQDQGVFLFDRNQPEVEALHRTTSLPLAHPLSIGLLDGRLYIGTDDGYLVVCDPAARTGEVLAASSRKEKASPFDDGPPVRISAIVPDVSRGRIVFVASVVHAEANLGKAVSAASGFWEYRPETESFRQLVEWKHRGNEIVWCGPAGEAAFAISDIWGRVLRFDMAADSLDVLTHGGRTLNVFDRELHRATGLDQPSDGVLPVEQRQAGISPPFLARGDWLWTASPWGRLSLKTYRWEELPPCRWRDGTVKAIYPYQGMAAMGAREILQSDRRSLWRMVLEREP